MSLPFVATCFAILAGILYTIPVLISAGFLAKVPTGENAVALVIPLFSSILAGICLLIANFCLAGCGKWVGIFPKPWLTSSLLFLFFALAAFGAFFSWVEPIATWTKPLALALGGIMPQILVISLVYAAWHSPLETHKYWTLLKWPWLIGCGFGLLFAIWGFSEYVKRVQANEARAWAQYEARERERERLETLPPIERLQEKYANFSPQAPLWVFLVDLVLQEDPACKDLVMKRSLQVPEWEGQLKSCLQSETDLYQRGALQWVCALSEGQLQPECAAWIAASIHITTQHIAKDPDWLTLQKDLNPDPPAHIEDLIAAAKRFSDQPVIQNAVQKLNHQLEQCTDNSAREKALHTVQSFAPSH